MICPKKSKDILFLEKKNYKSHEANFYDEIDVLLVIPNIFTCILFFSYFLLLNLVDCRSLLQYKICDATISGLVANFLIGQ